MNNLPSLFQSPLFLWTPIFILIAFTLMLIPSLMVPGAKVEGATKAIGCYIMKTFGLLLMSLSGVQLIYALITMNIPAFQTLAALVLLLVIGLGIIVYESTIVATVDSASSSVVRHIFSHACIVIGQLICILTVLSMTMTFFLTQRVTGWEMSSTLLLLGILLMLSCSVHIHAKKGVRAAAKPAKTVKKK